MPPNNHYILPLYSHGVITILYYLQMFICPTNQDLTHAICGNNFVQKASDDLQHPTWPLDDPEGLCLGRY
jgi:hypothetical protein